MSSNDQVKRVAESTLNSSDDSVLLQIKDIECERSDRVLFSGLNVVLRKGELMQIEGPNGAGKTSLIRILCGFLTPSHGNILFQGQDILDDIVAYQNHLLYIGHAHGIKAELSVKENLQFYTGISSTYTSANLLEAINAVGLFGYEDVQCSDLSAGQKRRVALARLLISSAKLWVLDEPFVALDKKGVVWLESLLIHHTQGGGSVIFTSHQDFTSSSKITRLDIHEFISKSDF